MLFFCVGNDIDSITFQEYREKYKKRKEEYK